MAKLLSIISKGFDQAGGATRAIQFVTIALDKGHQVEIFLIDSGHGGYGQKYPCHHR